VNTVVGGVVGFGATVGGGAEPPAALWAVVGGGVETGGAVTGVDGWDAGALGANVFIVGRVAGAFAVAGTVVVTGFPCGSTYTTW
jgi:hypothetical protein